ncbi:MAG: PD-(D/E)XK nuclease family protein [Holophagales bacterium]|jgi:hypothetical protein|nr:PD-(D/E)XK nuclease family protein [Holophagales bacterium]
MSYSPFDGVLLDDTRSPIPGALSMSLHFRASEQLAEDLNRPINQGRGSLESRAAACQELLAHGLSAETLRWLSKNYGLDLEAPNAGHSLNAVIMHMERYLALVESSGYLEPNAALWDAVSAELNGGQGLWSERTPLDGPIEATLKDLSPVRLRALATLPRLGGAIFRLATRKGGSASGLFGSGQPLVDWFLEGLEAHGQAFAADIRLSEPDGWGCAPWSNELDNLFDAPLSLNSYKDSFQRGLADGPFDLLRHAAEQIMAWINSGIAPDEIAVIHNAPENIRETLETLLLAEGAQLSQARQLRPLIQSVVWNPIWNALEGLAHLDPLPLSIGLYTSKRPEMRAWADILSQLDQSGEKRIEASIKNAAEAIRPKIMSAWNDLSALRAKSFTPQEWGEKIQDVAESLRFNLDSEDFYAPMGLLKECWHERHDLGPSAQKRWNFDTMLRALKAFLESARSSAPMPARPGVKLLSPSTVLEGWAGAAATLALDLSEGAWPALPTPNPDLDWERKAAINSALLKASQGYGGPFSPALQRFWLPRAEHSEQVPRSFQRDAYAFNKALAMTEKCFVALSPAQDADGRKLAQGPFWAALDGAQPWSIDENCCSSNLRFCWDGGQRTEQCDERSKTVQVRGTDAIFRSKAPAADRVQGLTQSLQNKDGHHSPTTLESLARCPFRTIAERVWKLGEVAEDDMGAAQKALGRLTHLLLHKAYSPIVGTPDWPKSFMAHYKLVDARPNALESLVNSIWLENCDAWIKDEIGDSVEQIRQARRLLEPLLPKMASYISNDLAENCPTVAELAFLYPDKTDMASKSPSNHQYAEGWSRTILGLEQGLGPIAIPLWNGKYMAISGIVDRIEAWDNRKHGVSFLRVVDYKTSTKSRLREYATDDAPFGAYLQVPLYMWMAMEKYEAPVASAMVPLRDAKPESWAGHLFRLIECERGTTGWQPTLARTLARLDERMERGDYAPTPGGHCRNCILGALCMRPVDVNESAGEADDED